METSSQLKLTAGHCYEGQLLEPFVMPASHTNAAMRSLLSSAKKFDILRPELGRASQLTSLNCCLYTERRVLALFMPPSFLLIFPSAAFVSAIQFLSLFLTIPFYHNIYPFTLFFSLSLLLLPFGASTNRKCSRASDREQLP